MQDITKGIQLKKWNIHVCTSLKLELFAMQSCHNIITNYVDYDMC